MSKVQKVVDEWKDANHLIREQRAEKAMVEMEDIILQIGWHDALKTLAKIAGEHRALIGSTYARSFPQSKLPGKIEAALNQLIEALKENGAG